jgi:hypothetical protein
MSSPNQIAPAFGVVASFNGGLNWEVAGTAQVIEQQTATLQRTAKRVDIQNSDGETVNVMFYDFGKTVAIQCYPRGSSLANASAVNLLDIKPGTLILLYSLAASTYADTILAANSGDSGTTGGTLYFVASFSKTHEKGNHVRWDMTLEKYDAMNLGSNP